MRSHLSALLLIFAILLPMTPILLSNIKALSTSAKASITRRSTLASTQRFSSILANSQKSYSTTSSKMGSVSEDAHVAPVQPSVEVKPDTVLPKLSTADFQVYNKLAVMMEYYHNHFRHMWRTLYSACETNKRPQGMSLTQFLNLGRQFISNLTAHHNIEEYHIFPVLAKNMPEFRAHSDMITQHKQIHDGLDRLEAYLDEVRRGERELRLNGDEGEGSLKEVMDSFGSVLWTHLDQEVKNLGAENMRKYWTKLDMAKFNF